ncbi:MAG: GMC family oxidoreductase N-terminal domain-containing protein [Betaproteobacteria bacterium]|nr:GMC family oxidoreductase N-terminal domain-containing protein [Betaproteobacteria bacterium]
MATREIFDYIVVGAGSAGCIIAGRLGEEAGARVLVLEAGGWDWDPFIHIPLGFGRNAGVYHDWLYQSEPEPAIGGRRMEQARGKVIGGCSSVNAMAQVRGHRSDYDRWAAAGLGQWSYAHALPYFRKMETWEGGESEYRGGSGPVAVQKNRYQDPIITAYAEAGRALGYPYNDDYNGRDQEGFAVHQLTIRNGRRCSAAVAYLRPAMKRGNVSVRVKALASRVLFEDERAVGVEYLTGGQTLAAYASREVILSGGVINTPQLLMLSGIGNPDELGVHGIKVKAPIKGVGKNLQDQVVARLSHLRKEPGPFHRMMRLDRAVTELGKAYLFGRGMATSLPAAGIAFLRSSPEAAVPDIQIVTVATPHEARPYLAPFVRPYQDLFVSRVILLRPESRGVLKLASKDPAAKPLIHQNMLSRDKDWTTFRAGVRILRALARQGSMRPFIGDETGPAPRDDSDREIDAYIRDIAVSFRHTLGTCKMGSASDPEAVVDPDLRVIGVKALRVVDASVMPDLVGGNINAAIMMIAEKASDLIRGRAPLAAADV